uniref:Uncharacterized protein n=1 Tax=Aegilops tauschii TaxID=37682 RepID=M8B8M0_AEGTA
MDGKNLGSGQLAQQAKPDALTDDQGTLKHTADSHTENPTSVNADDVMRAGGLGAKDDIGSLLPTAMDSTDFEASLRDARDFEGEQEQPARPGLGYRASEADAGIKPSDTPQQ